MLSVNVINVVHSFFFEINEFINIWNVLGFLSTNTEEIPGNAGQLDAILALKFVKENIEYFGGDPNQITIFGQSSGAAMVSALVISPSVPDDLFHKAIIQSGSILANWAYNIDPISDARRIAQEAGINPNQSISAINSEFMSMSVYNLLKAVDQYQVWKWVALKKTNVFFINSIESLIFSLSFFLDEINVIWKYCAWW